MNLAATATTEHSQPTAGHAPPSDISITECAESPPPHRPHRMEGRDSETTRDFSSHAHTHVHLHNSQASSFPAFRRSKRWHGETGEEREREKTTFICTCRSIFFVTPLQGAREASEASSVHPGASGDSILLRFCVFLLTV